MIHVFHTPTGWKVCQEYPEKPDYPCLDCTTMDCDAAKCTEKYNEAVALSIANAVDVREEDLHHLWNSNWFFNGQPHGHDYKDNEVYSLPELEMEIEVVETKVWFLEHVMSRAWVIQNNIAGFTWTNIPTEATQFSSSEEAQQYDNKSTQNGKELNAYPTEHIFYSKLAHVFRKKEEPKGDGQTNLEQYHDATGQITREEFDKMEERQEDLWVEVAYNFSITREFKDAYKTLQSKFHLTRVKAELKGEKK